LAAWIVALAAPALAQPIAWELGGFAIEGLSADAVFQCDTTPELATPTGPQLQNGTAGAFEVGLHEAGDFPGRMRTGDDFDAALADAVVLDSCQSVTVRYSLGGEGEPLACVDTEITWQRSGAEVDRIFHDGAPVGETSFEEGLGGFESFAVPGFQLPGVHSIRVRAVERNGGDGVYEPERLSLTCDPLSGFVQGGGGLQDPDVPAGGRGRNGGLKSPTHVVAALVGALEADGSPVGAVKIHYRRAFGGRPVHCRFTPGEGATIEIADGIATLGGWSYECRGPGLAAPVLMGTAELVLTGADGSGEAPKKGHDKHRGTVCVSADDERLAIGADCAGPEGGVDLDRGNLHVEGETLAPEEPPTEPPTEEPPVEEPTEPAPI
jgi:hypothetical protein